MSVTADAVLDAIDAALYDWTVSEDAMRWQPEEEREPEPETAGATLRLSFYDHVETLTAGLAVPEWESFPGSGVYYIPAGTYWLDGPLTLPRGTCLVGASSSEAVFLLDQAARAILPDLPPAPEPGWTVEHWPPVAPAWPPPATVMVRLSDPEQRAAWHAETAPGAVLPVRKSRLPSALAAAGLAGDGLAHLRPAAVNTEQRRRRRA